MHETRAIDRPPETRVCGRLGKRPSATACLAMARWKEAGVAAASCTASVAHSLLWSTSAPWPAAGCSASTMDSGGAPGWSEAVESAALEAAGSSTRGSGWASSGLASSWECQAAQSRQACPEEAQQPSWGTAEGGGLWPRCVAAQHGGEEEAVGPQRTAHAREQTRQVVHLVRVRGEG